MTSETGGTSSRVADSGLGGLGSSEENNWVSDDEVCLLCCVKDIDMYIWI